MCKTEQEDDIPPKLHVSTQDPTTADHSFAQCKVSILTWFLTLHSLAKQITLMRMLFIHSYCVLGLLISWPQHYLLYGSRGAGQQAAPWAGFEPSPYYFWHCSCHLLNKMRRLLAKVLKVRHIPSCLVNFSQVLSSSYLILPAPISLPCSLLSYNGSETA